jgi:hypothetical protein
MAKERTEKNASSATIGFEAKLWLAADSRGEAGTDEGNRSNNMDSAEFKHVVHGLIILKIKSASFEEPLAKPLAVEGDYARANPEDPDEYKVRTFSGGLPWEVLGIRHAISQVIRPSSSGAADFHSACRGKSKADFIAKLGTIEEETDGIGFRLEMLPDIT